MIPDTSLPNLFFHCISPKRNKILREEVKRLLQKGHIKETMSQYAFSALLTLKKDNSYGIYIDSKTINMIIVYYKFLIPKLDDMLDMLYGPILFSKINLHSGHEHIWIRLGDDWKTTFKTKMVCMNG